MIKEMIEIKVLRFLEILKLLVYKIYTLQSLFCVVIACNRLLNMDT